MKEPGLGCILKGRDGYLEARSGMNMSVPLTKEHDGRELVGSRRLLLDGRHTGLLGLTLSMRRAGTVCP